MELQRRLESPKYLQDAVTQTLLEDYPTVMVARAIKSMKISYGVLHVSVLILELLF